MEIEFKSIKKKKIRVGRGNGSGHGKTSTRGMNGQKSRAGSSTTFFEGGQTKLINRLPKARGFKSISKKFLTVTSDFIEKNFKPGEKITKDLIVEKLGLSKTDLLKIKGIKIIKGAKSNSNFEFAEDLTLSKAFKKTNE